MIDEIDCFESHEKAFLTLTKTLLKSQTNTSVIGIANSVDLPFKKKYSALAMRDIQLLFEPYSTDQLISIMEEKMNTKFFGFPMSLKALSGVFFNLVDERALNLIAKKVSKMNGDVRVAFDLMKTCLSLVKQRVEESDPLIDDSKIRVTCDIVC